MGESLRTITRATLEDSRTFDPKSKHGQEIRAGITSRYFTGLVNHGFQLPSGAMGGVCLVPLESTPSLVRFAQG